MMMMARMLMMRNRRLLIIFLRFLAFRLLFLNTSASS